MLVRGHSWLGGESWREAGQSGRPIDEATLGPTPAWAFRTANDCNKKRFFSPFFTARKKKAGLGLGTFHQAERIVKKSTAA